MPRPRSHRVDPSRPGHGRACGGMSGEPSFPLSPAYEVRFDTASDVLPSSPITQHGNTAYSVVSSRWSRLVPRAAALRDIPTAYRVVSRAPGRVLAPWRAFHVSRSVRRLSPLSPG